jgi:hypothetical protein
MCLGSLPIHDRSGKDRYGSATPSMEMDENSQRTMKSSVSVQDRTTALVRGLRVILRHHKCPGHVIDLMNIQMRKYLDTVVGEREWLKRAKHALVYPLAKYLRNEPPEAPDAVFEPAGKFRKWWKTRLTCFNTANSHLWYSWLQGKRCSLPAGVDMIEKTYQDHLKMLTSVDDGDDTIIEEIFANPTFANVLNRLKYQIAEKLKEEKDFTSSVPSGSACFEQKRSGGGQFGYLRSLLDEESFLVDELFEMCLKDHISPLKQFHFGPRASSARVREGQTQWTDTLRDLERCFPTDRRLGCIIQGILEPFKVRVISKGESIPYYSMKPVQQVIHGLMRKWNCFRLIGRPFTPTDMVDLRVNSQKTWEWFSVDYSAATDGLSYKYSGGILEEILELIPPHQYQRALQVLGMHDLYYPDKHEVYGYDRVTSVTKLGTMSRGQLMGSVLSFPILCLANLGVYLRTMQGVQRDWTQKQILNHVLINGDDMLYAAPAELWSEHIRVGKAVGLNMSVGKSYHHPVYANVNSTSVLYDLRQEASQPKQVGFLNTGLFFGQHKVQDVVDGDPLSEDEKDSISLRLFSVWAKIPDEDKELLLNVREDPAIVSSINNMLEGSLPSRARGVLGDYLTLHKEKIERLRMCLVFVKTVSGRRYPIFFKRNLFLPESSGGMGVKCPEGFRFRITRLDRKVAALLQSKNLASGFCTGSLPLPGIPVEDSAVAVPHLRKLSEGGNDFDVCDLGSNNFLKRKALKNGFFYYKPIVAPDTKKLLEPIVDYNYRVLVNKAGDPVIVYDDFE